MADSLGKRLRDETLKQDLWSMAQGANPINQGPGIPGMPLPGMEAEVPAELPVTGAPPAKPLGKNASLKRTVSDKGDEEQAIMSFVTPQINEEKWQEISQYVNRMMKQAILLRSELDNDLKVFNDLYEGAVPELKTIPWEGCANINVPITQEMLDGLHSRLAKSALGVEPLALVKGQDASGVEVEYKLERYFDALGRAIDLPEAISQGVFLSLRDGVGLLKIMWDRRMRRVKTRKMKPLLDEAGQQIFDPILQTPLREETVEVEELVEFDNVRVVPVELKDFYLLPAHAYDITRYYAKGVAERFWLRWDEINQRVQSGMYRKDPAEMLKAGSTENRDYIEPEHQEHIGVGVYPDQDEFEEYELFDVYMNYDLDGDGYEEECVFTVAPSFNILLRAEVFPYWHQLRPYVPIIPWPRPRRFYGFSVPQRLEPIQRELNAMHNQRLDAVTIRLSPPLLISRSAILRGDASQSWGPGARIEVNDPKEVMFPTLPDINASSFSEETILRQYAERIVGLYDINTPRGTGARRTRAEIGAIQQEGMVRFDYMMKRIQKAIEKVFEQMYQLKLQYMPEQEIFEAVGTDGVQKFELTRAEMLANIKFIPNGDLPVEDKERNRQDAYFLYQALMANPLVAPNLSRVFHVTKKLLEAWEEKAPEKYIGTREEAEQQQMMMMQQQAMGGGQPSAQPQRGRRPGGTAGGQEAPG